MSKDHSVLSACLIALMFAGCSTAYAQATYPTKGIRLVTGFTGGYIDSVARILAEGLTNSLGQRVIVDNQGAGNGVVAAQIVTRSSADGYTLLLFFSNIWLLPFMQDNLPYDPVKDFAPISLTDSTPNVLLVHPSLPVKSVRELIILARARPGELNYSRATAGGATHLAAELFKTMAGLNIVSVPYRGAAGATLAALAGEVELTFAALPVAAPLINSKRMRALAVTSAEPSPQFPGLPTMAASGLPGFESIITTGLFARAGTSASIINKLNQEVVQTLRRPETKERFSNVGAQTVGSSPEELGTLVKADMAKWGKLIKALNIRSD